MVRSWTYETCSSVTRMRCSLASNGRLHWGALNTEECIGSSPQFTRCQASPSVGCFRRFHIAGHISNLFAFAVHDEFTNQKFQSPPNTAVKSIDSLVSTQANSEHHSSRPILSTAQPLTIPKTRQNEARRSLPSPSTRRQRAALCRRHQECPLFRRYRG